MSRPDPRSTARRLHADASRLADYPSSDARRRLRAALDSAERRAIPAIRERRPARVVLPLLGAAAAAAWFAVAGPWAEIPASKPQDAGAGDVRIAMPDVPHLVDTLMRGRPLDAVEFVAERPLRGELDAIAHDAAAVADAVLRRLPRSLVPNRARSL